MIYLKEKGTSLSMKIIDYEFPSITSKFDAEWLIIEVQAEDSTYNWSCRGPILRTSELIYLRDWLIAISVDQKTAVKTISFTEDELSFEFSNGLLAIVFEYSFHPLGEKYDWESGVPYKLCFKLDNSEIKSIVNSLTACIQQYNRQ